MAFFMQSCLTFKKKLKVFSVDSQFNLGYPLEGESDLLSF